MTSTSRWRSSPHVGSGVSMETVHTPNAASCRGRHHAAASRDGAGPAAGLPSGTCNREGGEGW